MAMIDSTNIDFHGMTNDTFALLRDLWKSAGNAETRNKIERVASALEAIAGDRDYLESMCEEEAQAEYREMILSY